MVTKEFEKQYSQLNPAQKEAVDAIEGAIMVVAGPGTGKTKTLTLRIANILIKTQINPENILALTFTEAAAHEMRNRLIQIIGHDAYRVEITTFHSFCNYLIKRNQEEFSEIISSESANEIDQLEIIEQAMGNLELELLRPLGDLSYYVRPILSQINQLKQENITPEKLEGAIDSAEKEITSSSDLYHEKGAHKGKMKSQYLKTIKDLAKDKELLMVYKEYVRKMTELKKYDYNDMLLKVIEKFESHPYLLQLIQEKFQYFLVDEHQDTNAAQNKIVELLAGYFANPNLFVVGDEKQAIFRFQGATLENFLYFKKRYPNAKLINLAENYRSTKTILDATHKVILNNPQSENILVSAEGLIKKSLHPEENITIAKLSTPTMEQYWIAQKIRVLLQTTPAHEIAVLGRNNRDLYPLVSVFDAEQIPYVLISDNNILDDLYIQKFITLLKAISAPMRNEYIAQALFLSNFKLETLDVLRIIRERSVRKENIWDVLSGEEFINQTSFINRDALNSFINLFTDKDTGFISIAKNERFDRVFVNVLNDSGLLQEVLANEYSQEVLAKFTRLYEEVKNEIGKNLRFSIDDFLKYIDLLNEHNISLKQNNYTAPHGMVRLMTVHKSKGLEFDYVFLTKAYSGHWGNQRKRGLNFQIPWEELGLRLGENSDDGNSDERRLFYVALTRARKNIFISYSQSSEDGSEQTQSEFVTEIPEELIQSEEVSSFEKQYLLHQEKLFEVSDKSIIPSEVFTKEFVGEVFSKQGLSVSGLNNYLECPWRYFFVNLIRVPEMIEDPGLYGNAIHAALNRYLVALKRNKASKEILLDAFNEEILIQPISHENVERYTKRGVEALDGFFEKELVHVSKEIETELDIKGIRLNEDITINGKIDMIEILEKDFSVNVTDFKTGKVRSRNEIEGNVKNGTGNYKRQLVFYKLLLDRFRNGYFKMKKGVIQFVEPNEKGVYKKEEFEISKTEVKELLETIERVYSEIVNLSFWDKRCDDKECQYCRLRDFMIN